MSAILGLITFVQTKRKTFENESERSKLVASRFGIFLALTYVVYASTSSAIFETFLCTRYGDDPTRYLLADRSISCDTTTHSLYEIYAGVMILVYPIGITAMYAYLLIINRVAIMDEETREDNEGIRYLVFLFISTSYCFVS